MIRYLLRRLLVAIPLMLGVATLVFVLLETAPGRFDSTVSMSIGWGSCWSSGNPRRLRSTSRLAAGSVVR